MQEANLLPPLKKQILVVDDHGAQHARVGVGPSHVGGRGDVVM